MQLETSRFGTIHVSKEQVLIFPEGLLGFESQKEYALLPAPNNQYFYWLQSTTVKELAFLVVDPFVFFPRYGVDLDKETLQHLKISEQKQVAILTIVTIPKADVKQATTNLVGPLVLNLKERLGAQIVLEGNQYTTKHQLVAKKPAFQESR